MRDGFQSEGEELELGSTADASPDSGELEPGLRDRVNQTLGGRPLMVYLVLFAGAATLVLLLAIVWVSATGSGNDERPICTSATAAEAQQLVLAGQVDRINVLVDREQPLDSLTGIVFELTDGTCRNSAQGADIRNDLYAILGVVGLYNNFGESRVRVHYQRQELDPSLLVTSTPTSEPTLVPTETPTIEPTLEPTALPTETPTAEPTATSTSTSTATATSEPEPTTPAVISAPTMEPSPATPSPSPTPSPIS